MPQTILERAIKYRERAEVMRRSAAAFDCPIMKHQLTEIANGWDAWADELEHRAAVLLTKGKSI